MIKRYHAGTAVKTVRALTFGTVYISVDRSMPFRVRVWRTTINWLDANRIGMTFSFSIWPRSAYFPCNVAPSLHQLAVGDHAVRRGSRRAACRLH